MKKMKKKTSYLPSIVVEGAKEVELQVDLLHSEQVVRQVAHTKVTNLKGKIILLLKRNMLKGKKENLGNKSCFFSAMIHVKRNYIKLDYECQKFDSTCFDGKGFCSWAYCSRIYIICILYRK